MPKFIIFRHAQSTDNVAHTFSGKRDPQLTPQGIEEAREIQEKLKNEKVTKAFSSDKIRAKKTLEIVLKSHPQAKMQMDPRINERDYGELTGKNKDDISREFTTECDSIKNIIKTFKVDRWFQHVNDIFNINCIKLQI